jgi:hypothetical protein
LIEREPMVVDRADSPQGVEVRLSIASLLLLLTVLLGSAIMSFELLSVYEADYDTPLALLIAKPMPVYTGVT